MSFKKWTLAGTLIVFGCGPKNNAQKPPPRVGAASPRNQCLGRARATMKSYADGAMGESDVGQFFGCLKSAMNTFERYTAGSKPDRYTAQELRYFLEQAFLDGAPLPDQTVRQMMTFKQLIVAGSAQEITRAELKSLDQFLSRLQDMLIAARPFVPEIYHPSTAQNLAAAVKGLRHSLEPLGRYLQQGQRTLPMANVMELVQSFVTLDLKPLAPVINDLKGLIVAPPRDQLAPDDWPVILDRGLEAMGLYLEALNFRGSGSWHEPQNFHNLIRLVDPLWPMLEDAIRRQPTQTWSEADIQQLIADLRVAGYVPAAMSPEALAQALHALVQTVLAPAGAAPTPGLGPAHLQELHHDWQHYVADQQKLFVHPILPGQPLHFDQHGRWVIDALTSKDWDPEGLAHVELQRVVVQRLFRGYAKAKPGELQPAELLAFVSDFSKLLENVTGSSPQQFTKRIMMEARVFLPASDGQKPIDVTKGAQYLNALLAGFQAGHHAYQVIQRRCGPRPCDMRAPPPPETLAHLPQMLSYMRQGHWAELQSLVEQAVRSGKTTGELTAGDFAKMWILMSYIEQFYQRFDLNRDGVIDTAESLVAYPIYGSTLGELLGGFNLGDQERRSFFTYLFNFGQTPFDDFAGSLRFLYWTWHESKWNYVADRVRLAQILAKLSSF